MSRLAMFLLLVAACAAPQAEERRSTAPPGATQARESDEDHAPVCHEESVTGSNLTRTVCRSKSDEERQRKDAQDFSAKTGRGRQTLKSN